MSKSTSFPRENILVFHPSSTKLRFGRSNDPQPIIIPHCIARKVKSSSNRNIVRQPITPDNCPSSFDANPFARGCDGGPMVFKNAPSKTGNVIIVRTGSASPFYQKEQSGSGHESACQAHLLTPHASLVSEVKGDTKAFRCSEGETCLSSYHCPPSRDLMEFTIINQLSRCIFCNIQGEFLISISRVNFFSFLFKFIKVNYHINNVFFNSDFYINFTGPHQHQCNTTLNSTLSLPNCYKKISHANTYDTERQVTSLYKFPQHFISISSSKYFCYPTIKINFHSTPSSLSFKLPLQTSIQYIESLLLKYLGCSVWLCYGTKPLRQNLSLEAYGITECSVISAYPRLCGGMDPSLPTDETTNAISIPPTPPPYFLDPRGSPQCWLDLLELRFKSQRISSQESLFHHTLAVLPADLLQSIATQLSVIAKSKDPYNELRRQLLLSFTPSFEEIFTKYFTSQSLGNSTPSEFLERITKELEALHPGITSGTDTTLLKRFFLKALPPLVQAVLAGTSITDLKDLSIIANNIMATQPIQGTHADPNSFRYPMMSMKEDKPPQASSEEQITTLSAQISSLQMEVNNLKSLLTTKRTTATSPKRGRSNSRSRLLCFYHQKFGDRARKCQLGCEWTGDRSVLETSATCIFHHRYGERAQRCISGCKYKPSEN